MVTQYFSSNFSEITKSKALSFFGAALAITHLLTFYRWTHWGEFNRFLEAYQSIPICWPFFNTCRPLSWPSWGFHGYLTVYFSLSLLTTIGFLIPRLIRWALGGLVLLTAMKAVVSLSDYRFMGNYHYMVYWVTVFFLFIPEKKKTLPLLMVLFYFFAGTLKLNTEWLFGHALLKPLPFPASWTPWLCGLVIPLELIAVWGLLASKIKIRWMVLGLLAVFHVISYFVVGSFYPLIMSCLLSFFVFQDLLEKDKTYSFPQRWSSRAILLIFVLCQLTPYFFKGDSTLTSQGRLLSLNMLDAIAQCEALFVVKGPEAFMEVPRNPLHLAPRIHCDPLVIFAEAQSLCQENKNNPEFLELELRLYSKRTSDKHYQEIFHYKNFCERDLKISFLGGLPPSDSLAMPSLDLKHQVQFRGGAQRTGMSHETLAPQRATKVNLSGKNTSNYSASKGSPVIDNDGIFVGGDDGTMYGYDQKLKSLWRYHTYHNHAGIHGTPAILGDLLLFGAYNGRLYALNKKTGDLLWTQQLGTALGSSPLLDDLGDIYVSVELSQPNDGFVAKISPAGKLLWTSEFLGEQPHSSPTLSEDQKLVFIGANNGHLFAFRTNDGSLVWKTEVKGAIKSTPALLKNLVVVTDRKWGVTAYDISTGKEKWSRRMGKDGVHGSPALLPERDQVLVVDTDGNLWNLKLSSGDILWQQKIGDAPYKMSPLITRISNSKWAVWVECTFDALCAVDTEKGSLLSKSALDGRLSGEPAPFQGAVYLSLDAPGSFTILKSSPQ